MGCYSYLVFKLELSFPDQQTEEILEFSNWDLENVQTPIDVDELEHLLRLSMYDPAKTSSLVRGFRDGFDLNYQGPTQRKNRFKNIPFTVGNKVEMWNKIMKEVSLGRYAGPFKEVPYKFYVQSPIGLVPKAGNQTRLIFHLSYNFKDFKSVNFYTPKDSCTVKYRDLDFAIKEILELIQQSSDRQYIIWFGKSDLKSAFRILGMNPSTWWLMIMCAEHPANGKQFFFVDKCLPFGHSISCVLFQSFSDALDHILKFIISQKTLDSQRRGRTTNYLDDFLLIALTKFGVISCYRNFWNFVVS